MDVSELVFLSIFLIIVSCWVFDGQSMQTRLWGRVGLMTDMPKKFCVYRE